MRRLKGSAADRGTTDKLGRRVGRGEERRVAGGRMSGEEIYDA
jgi:hypothetical protein